MAVTWAQVQARIPYTWIENIADTDADGSVGDETIHTNAITSAEDEIGANHGLTSSQLTTATIYLTVWYMYANAQQSIPPAVERLASIWRNRIFGAGGPSGSTAINYSLLSQPTDSSESGSLRGDYLVGVSTRETIDTT